MGLSLTVLIPARAAPNVHPEDQLFLGMHSLHTTEKILKSGLRDLSNVPRSLSSFLILPFPERSCDQPTPLGSTPSRALG